MADLTALDQYIGKYVDIMDPNGEGLAGVIDRVFPLRYLNGVPVREVVVDYGYAWCVSADTTVKVMEEPSA